MALLGTYNRMHRSKQVLYHELLVRHRIHTRCWGHEIAAALGSRRSSTTSSYSADMDCHIQSRNLSVFEIGLLDSSLLGQPSTLLAPPRPSQNRLRPPTFSFLGTSSPPTIACFSMALLSLSLLLNRQMRMPTPVPSLRLSRIALAFFSRRTRKPSLSLSRSKRRLLCTSGPATPIPHTKLPECRSILQHSFGSMFAETKESSLGRRERQRLRRMLTRDQCSRRAAIWVRVK
jgi:hypothetical protein